MKILITGATGFVGRTLIQELKISRPEDKLSILILPGESVPESFTNQNIEIYKGNIINPDEVNEAVNGKDIVLHLAGLISYWKYDIPKLNAVNVDGVRNIVNAVKKYKIKRLVHISSVGSVGFNMDGSLADEDTPYNWPDSLPYMTTKKMGEDVVMEAAQNKEINAVILNPASIMGPGDPSPETAHNKLYGNIYDSPFFFGSFTGGLAIVDVRDLCRSITQAISKGDSGERYLITGANITYSGVLRLIGKFAQKTVLPFPIPPFIMVIAGGVMELISGITKKRPLLTSGYGKLSGWFAYYSNQKSIDAFDLEYHNIEDTIKDGCEYYERMFQ